MRAVFGWDACHLFHQVVLAVIALLGVVQVHRCMACTGFQEGGGCRWLLVSGHSSVVAVGCTPTGKLALGCGTLGSSGSGLHAAREVGTLLGTGW